MKNYIIVVLIVLLAGVGLYFWLQQSSETTMVDPDNSALPAGSNDVPAPRPSDSDEVGDESDGEVSEPETETVIGTSAGGDSITAYHYGEGDTNLLFVGGVHAGYSPNTVSVAREMMQYFETTPEAIPDGVRVTVIPELNPDSAEATNPRAVGGRLNANQVDLNRNFDCQWQAEGVWQSTPVSGGASAFSEPEAKALRDYVAVNTPDAAVVYYSSAGGVFASSCNNGVSAETRNLTNVYAEASGYQAFEEFDFYEITGDLVNWLAKEGVPAVSVLLSDHTSVEWSQNQAGIDAVIGSYAE